MHWTCNLIGEGWFIMRSFTTDFVTFTPAEKWLSGAGMDATVVQDSSSGTFYRISKNGPDQLIEQARASSLNGPWTVIRNRIGQGLPAGEGPLVFRDNVTPSRVSTSPEQPATSRAGRNAALMRQQRPLRLTIADG